MRRNVLNITTDSCLPNVYPDDAANPRRQSYRNTITGSGASLTSRLRSVLSTSIIAGLLLSANSAFATLTLSVSASENDLTTVGSRVTVIVDVTASDNETNVDVSSPLFGDQVCRVPVLSAGITATCTGAYFVTAADISAGSITSTINVSSDADTTGSSTTLLIEGNGDTNLPPVQDTPPDPITPEDTPSVPSELSMSVGPAESTQIGGVLPLTVRLENKGQSDLSNIRVVREDTDAPICEASLLSAGYALVCNGVHTISEEDRRIGQLTINSIASADGLNANLTASASYSFSGALDNPNNPIVNPDPEPIPDAPTPVTPVTPVVDTPAEDDPVVDNPGVGGAIPLLGLSRVSDEAWNTTAVSKVLQIFAWGGHASAQQIKTWADMSPDAAITEMLNFKQHNWRLSPRDKADDLTRVGNTLNSLSEFWSSSDNANKVPYSERIYYAKNGSVHRLWATAGLARGLNPFHHKIGMWETNYHMAVNLDSQVNGSQMIRYYDDIMEGHRTSKPYQDIINTAALSAAVSTQYMHRRNRWKDDECLCNEDFAREYFQLFFGILGTGDSEYHENVTIKNMARALTDVRVNWDSSTNRLPDVPTFGSKYHYKGALPILRNEITGSNTKQRVTQLSDIAINHWESKQILPVKIIRDLADDNLDSTKITQIRSAWQSMLDGDHRFLDFIRAYAVSTLFHNPSRIKHWTSFDRHMLIANRLLNNNRELYLNLYQPTWMYGVEGLQVFRPLHNVFGAQTSQEAMENPFYFLKAFNRSTRDVWNYLEVDEWKYNNNWQKDWASVIPRSANGEWVVKDVAEWLWNHLTFDGLANYSALEKAHLHALLGSKQDLMLLTNRNKPNAVFNKFDIDGNTVIKEKVENLGNRTIDLDNPTQSVRAEANKQIGRAFAFIAATPYIFAQTGK